MLVGFDFSNLVIRQAANPYNTDTDPEGRDISGVTGALRQIFSTLESSSASQALIAADGPRAALERRRIDPGYKAHRTDSDDDLTFQFLLAETVLRDLGMPLSRVEGHEADDVLASGVTQWPGPALVVTGDKDLLALCSEQVTVRLLRPGRYIDCQSEQCLEIFGVPPERVSEYKALAGDRGDGITGVPGIGDKRARALLAAYPSLQSLLDADFPLPDFPPSVSKALEKHRREAEISHELAKLRDDLPDIQAHPVGSVEAMRRRVAELLG